MLHIEDPLVRKLLFKGDFGLERESLRITEDGFMAQTPDPFAGNPHVVRDFCECQVEINTGVQQSPAAVIAELARHDKLVQTTLAAAEPRELLWPFSNPPYLRDEQDIPIAQYTGDEAPKTTYREHLAQVYGRYKMTFCGIHFNFSFARELLEADFALSDFAAGAAGAAGAGEAGTAGAPNERAAAFTAYQNDLYLKLAERCVEYAWLMSAITAASPLMDSSFVEQGKLGADAFLGTGSVRCSEQGYWNYFTPSLDYSSVAAYAASIQRYVDEGYLQYPSELYYPVRIKPHGAYSMENLTRGGATHIELRMFDLNPLEPLGICETDVFFSQLLLIWLASTPGRALSCADQIQAIQNFKSAAHYDLQTAKVAVQSRALRPVSQAALDVLSSMEAFFCELNADQCAEQGVFECLAFERAKFTDAESNNYAHVVRRAYEGGFVEKGLVLARQRQAEALVRDDSLA